MSEPSAIINPYRSPKAPKLGSLAVMVATRNDLAGLVKRLNFSRESFKRIFTSRLYCPQFAGKPLAVAGPMMGAPYAAAILETLIGWGARQILFWGWCGGIDYGVRHGDLIVPSRALSAEGTSRHYHPDIKRDDPVEPAARLQNCLGQALDNTSRTCRRGAVWTTDAIFRETREQVRHLQGQGVLAVEMELAALFSVARFRGVELGAGLVVSDELASLTWRPGFKTEAFQQGRTAGLEGLLACCRNLLEDPDC